ncbi:ribonuclease H [Trifolium pratense]|uniref:Ribonuclease H n=1 Tax=Trifolium pratense TaxID=57577 RepID=A0A2K3JVK0_TRIPR|nr:ribonuclease H [Trifolium pratense]
MMKKAVDVGRFRGFKVNVNLHFQLLQFADDTIIMGEGGWENFWTIKSMLRGFELVFGLKINFVKSKLYSINVGARLLEAGASFLACNTATIPFKFLGIPVGANPRRRETWKPVVEAMAKRLNSWHNRHLSFGGCITQINSVLAIIMRLLFSTS